MKLVECVPNFSEGRDRKVIDSITDAIVAAGGVKLMDVDPGEATNRTVVTFVGPPDAVVDAAFAGIARAAQLIDMSQHSGAHPRFGGTDVCPFVPVEGVTMEDCAELAARLGARVGEELGIPVYLYEHAARSPQRRNLADVRRGEYEGLPAKLADPAWAPDFGPAAFNARAGAVAISAREFLVAYNITLNTKNPKLATDIAFELREKGRSARSGSARNAGPVLYHRAGALRCGQCDFSTPGYPALEEHVRSEHGWELSPILKHFGMEPPHIEDKPVKVRGAFDHCKAIGWYVQEYGRAQISVNLTDYNITPPHLVLEKARDLARERGLVVTGSEIVGLVPFSAMVMAGRWYLQRQGASTGLPPRDLVEVAVQSMGLEDVSTFDIDARVLGLPVQGDDDLVSLSAKGFVDEVSRPSPAPGGGSVAALGGALGAALAAMVANLSTARRPIPEFVALADRAQDIKERLCRAVDADTQAFNDYMTAMRLPDKTPQEREAKQTAVQAGLRAAVLVPLETAELSLQAMSMCREVARTGLAASASDAGVGAQMAHVGVVGGCLNVLINLADVIDADFCARMTGRCSELQAEGRSVLEEALAAVTERMPG